MFSASRVDYLTRVYRDGLLEDVLPFWLEHGVDREHGGVLTCLDRDGTVVDTDKGMWQQARFCWLLGELYNNVETSPLWLETAVETMEFIESHGFDPADGRMWFQVTREGLPLRKRRYAFTESFTAIAYGELAQATGKEEYAKRAIECFHRFESQMQRPVDAHPKFTETRVTRGLGFPMITINTAQQLRDSIRWEQANAWIDRSIQAIEQFHLDHERECVLEIVASDGKPIDHFDGRTLNPGHAIEGAWFILWEGHHRNDQRLVALGCRMLDWMWQRGWDPEHGGLLYFVDVDGGQVQEYWHDMKFWWPQNETVIATLLAYLLTGNSKYAEWHTQIHDWAYRLFPDSENGEWFGYFHRDGRRSSTLKGNLWKGPFHLPRMQLMCSQLLSSIPPPK